MEQFFSLKVEIPGKAADIPKAIDALKAKKQHFSENQDRVTKENIAKAKAMEDKLLSGQVRTVQCIMKIIAFSIGMSVIFIMFKPFVCQLSIALGISAAFFWTY